MSKKIIVLGAGGWGTALANLLSDNHIVSLWSYEKSVCDEINYNHTNTVFLPSVELNPNIVAHSDLSEIENNEIILNTIPTQFIRENLKNYKELLNNKLIVNGSKGIEKDTLSRISQIFIDDYGVPPENFVALSGPSHAEEVSRKLPTAVVAASLEISTAKLIQKDFSTPEFRIYTSEDVIGTEIGGALKNVIAIAAGIIDGLKLGDNTKAALITRGIAELLRLGVACGAMPWTFSGLSGLGDLFVTCNSKHSRNRLVGELIGRGQKLSEIIASMKMVAEGVVTTESALNLGKEHKVEMPITEQVYKILFKDLDPLDAIKELLTRESKKEWGW